MSFKDLTILLAICAAFLIAGAVGLAAADSLYKCDGSVPLYTDKASYGCPAYEPTAQLTVVPDAARAWRERGKGIEGYGDTGVANPVLLPRETIAASPAAADTCALYKEWLDLNDRTRGGTSNQGPDERARWHTLSRMFTVVGVPAFCR